MDCSSCPGDQPGAFLHRTHHFNRDVGEMRLHRRLVRLVRDVIGRQQPTHQLFEVRHFRAAASRDDAIRQS